MPLIDYTLPSRLFQQLQLQFQFFTSHLLLYDFVFVLLSCSVAQLFDCVQRQSKTPAVNHGHGENKSRSPDTGGVHSTADDRTLIKNGCTEHRELGTGTQPSPAQASPAQASPAQPSSGRTRPDDCLTALYMARQNRKRNVASGRGTSRGSRRGI